MKVDLEGGCLCGGVRYHYVGELGGGLGAVTQCHCGQCRKAQGGPGSVAPVAAAGFAVTRGEALIRSFESSPGKQRAFCGVCGSPIWSRRTADPAVMRLRLGSLDNAPPSLRIEAHIYTDGAPAWDAEGEAAPRYPGLEPGRSCGLAPANGAV